MVRECVRMIVGVAVSAVVPAAVLSQESPTVYRVVTDPNGNTVATQTLPDGTVVPVDLRQNGIVLDPGDVSREFTVGTAPRAGLKAGGGQPVDVAQIRQQAAERLANAFKQQLGCTDEEWNVLGSKIQAIQLLQAALGERRASPGDKVAILPMPSIMAAITDLRAKQREFNRSIAEHYPQQDLKSRMVSLRESRSQARQELVRAQKELAELVTIHQEAVLVERRILE